MNFRFGPMRLVKMQACVFLETKCGKRRELTLLSFICHQTHGSNLAEWIKWRAILLRNVNCRIFYKGEDNIKVYYLLQTLYLGSNTFATNLYVHVSYCRSEPPINGINSTFCQNLLDNNELQDRKLITKPYKYPAVKYTCW